MALRVEVAGVHQVDSVWPLVADGLERACRATGGELTADYLWGECRAGRAFLLVVADIGIRAAAVLRFEQWSTGKKLRCLALYGTDMRDWLPQLTDAAKQLAKVGGATSLVSDGRKGWARLFNGKVLRQTYEVELT